MGQGTSKKEITNQVNRKSKEEDQVCELVARPFLKKKELQGSDKNLNLVVNNFKQILVLGYLQLRAHAFYTRCETVQSTMQKWWR